MATYASIFAKDYPAIVEFKKSIDWSEVPPWDRYEIYFAALKYYEARKDYDMAQWSWERLCDSRSEPIEPYDDVVY